MTDTQTQATPETLRAELEATRTSYHQLLESLGDDDMKKKSANPEWNVGQLLWHLAWGQDHVPGAVARVKAGKNFSVPRGPFNLINPWITRIGARSANRKSLGERYDRGYTKIVAALDSITADDCAKAAMFMGEERSVAGHFQTPIVHFKEHQADILKGLGR